MTKVSFSVLGSVLGLVGAVVLGATNAFAIQDPPMTYLGAVGGVSSPSYDGAQAQMALGGEFGRRLTPDFGVGAYFLRSSQEASAILATLKTALSRYGIEGTYYFTGDTDGLTLGARLGMTSLATDTSSSTVMSFGPKLGFDYRLMPGFSLGFEGAILFQGSGQGMPSYSDSQILGSLKLWM